jgi:FAD/FMN-containing dehydrogenase
LFHVSLQHSYAANGLGGKDGTLVVDLRNLSTITVDSSTFIASVDTGLRLGDVATAINNADGGPRALPHGTCPTVGIGGHAGHAGFGFQSRYWGFALDTIVAMDVVLPDGSLVHASNDENTDVFWVITHFNEF